MNILFVVPNHNVSCNIGSIINDRVSSLISRYPHAFTKSFYFVEFYLIFSALYVISGLYTLSRKDWKYSMITCHLSSLLICVW